MPTPAETLEPRWRALWERLSARGDPKKIFDQLVWLYVETHRRYHTLSHIAHCFHERDAVRPTLGLAQRQQDVIEAALWFHDAIYIPGFPSSEDVSASYAWRMFHAASLPANFSGDVAYFIQESAAHHPVKLLDLGTFLDIDLAILGRPEAEFDTYEEGIRFEYQRVPEELFRAGRIAVLDGFLAREHIYQTDHFHRKYETQANANLERSITKLRGV